MRGVCVVWFACASLTVPTGAGAQVSADGSLVALPFPLPWPSVSGSETEGALVRVVAASHEECVAWFQEALAGGAELADGWRVSGQGWDTAQGVWLFGLLADDRVQYDVSVAPDDAGCRLTVQTEPEPIPGGRWIWDYPPFRLSDGTEVDFDPLIKED